MLHTAAAKQKPLTDNNASHLRCFHSLGSCCNPKQLQACTDGTVQLQSGGGKSPFTRLLLYLDTLPAGTCHTGVDPKPENALPSIKKLLLLAGVAVMTVRQTLREKPMLLCLHQGQLVRAFETLTRQCCKPGCC